MRDNYILIWYRLRNTRHRIDGAHVLRKSVFLVLLLFLGKRGFAEEYATIQSTIRPLGLEIVDRVKLADSDAASSEFQKKVLPIFQNFINLNLGESTSLTMADITNHALDPERLSLAVETSVRVYFVHEGAGYRNTLGFNTENGGAHAGNPKIIFPDVTCSPDTTRSTFAPLRPGDYVDLGTFAGGTQLRFFLIADGARRGRNVFSTEQSLNGDGLQHVVAFAGDETPYLLIGFEDLWGGGDRDYNDCLFAVDIGKQNVRALSEAASATVEEMLTPLIDRLMEKLARLEPGTIAYSGFANPDSHRPDIAVLIDRMARKRISETKGFELIAADVLQQTLTKEQVTSANLIDTSLVLRIGQALSADYFFTGLIISTGEAAIVFDRIVNVATAAIEVSSQIVLPSLPP
jgi:hypothetical protein